jgi:RimJ/RimL family protein N-acetyltransferase
MEKKDIANYACTEALRDRRSVTIRAIHPDDKGSLIDALNKVSSQSLHFRLFSGKRKFSDEEMNQLTAVDFINIVALVAVLEKDGIEQIAGGGRYVRIGTSGTGQSAEVAFLIDDAHQGLGIGSRIFRHLVQIACESGITHFEAEVLPTNAPMLNLFARSGLPVEKTLTGGSVHVTIQLAPAHDARRGPCASGIGGSRG